MPITEFLERNAREFPNDVCLVEINPEIKEDRRVTWKEYELIEPSPKTSYRREITWSVFNEKANRFANLLIQRGIQKGDKVAILMMNGLEWLPIYFGILKTGALAVPLNFRYSADEIEYLEKRDVGRRVVEDTAQRPGEGEERNRVERQSRRHLAQQDQRRNHRQEDADKKRRHLLDRRPGKGVELESPPPVAEEVGRRRRAQHDDLAPRHKRLPARAAVVRRLQINRRHERHRRDDRAKAQQLPLALDAERGRLRAVQRQRRLGLHGVGAPFNRPIDEEQQPVHEEPRRKERKRPGEGHAAQHPEKERRIAQRREQAAAISHDEDGEDDRVRLDRPLLVGAQNRPDQQHGRARGADQRGEQRATGQKGHVDARFSPEIARDVDAAADDEERQKQRDELNVFDERVDHVLGGPQRPHGDANRQTEDERDGQLNAPLLPEMPRGWNEWKDRDAHKEQRKGNAGPKRQRFDHETLSEKGCAPRAKGP